MINFLASVSVPGNKQGYLYQRQTWHALPSVGHNYGLRGAGLCPVVDVNHVTDHAIPHITVDMHVTAEGWKALVASGTWYNDVGLALGGEKSSSVAA